MGSCRNPNEEDDRYYDQIIGAVIVAVHQDDESVWIHLSTGDLLEFMADPRGGFEAEIHPHDDDGELPAWPTYPAPPTD